MAPSSPLTAGAAVSARRSKRCDRKLNRLRASVSSPSCSSPSWPADRHPGRVFVQCFAHDSVCGKVSPSSGIDRASQCRPPQAALEHAADRRDGDGRVGVANILRPAMSAASNAAATAATF